LSEAFLGIELLRRQDYFPLPPLSAAGNLCYAPLDKESAVIG